MNETYELSKEAYSQIVENLGVIRQIAALIKNHSDSDTLQHGRVLGTVEACERWMKTAVMVPAVDEDMFSDIEEEVING